MESHSCRLFYGELLVEGVLVIQLPYSGGLQMLCPAQLVVNYLYSHP